MKKEAWHAVYVKSRTEKKVAKLLTEKNIVNYVPLIKTMRQWSDRKKIVEVPLLNGYVFFQKDPLIPENILQTPGVVNFVRSGGKIADIFPFEIERLKQLVSLGYHLEVSGVDRDYKKGERVKIVSGVLKGIEGIVVEKRENMQIEVVLESIGQCIRVCLPHQLLSVDAEK